MPPADTIAALNALAAPEIPEDPAQALRILARLAWSRDLIARTRAAQRRADDAWMALMKTLPEDEDEEAEALAALAEPPEQAELDALWAILRPILDHDRWPREMHFGEV